MLHYSDIDVLFGQYDTDVIIKYTMHLSFRIENGKELLYDEIPMITSLNVQSSNDIVYIKVLNNKIDNKNHRSKKPMRGEMILSPVEYREFISTFGFTMNYMKKWLNQVVFRQGLKFPFRMEELETQLKFQEQSMHILIDV